MYDTYLKKLEEIGKLRNLKPRTIQTYQNNIGSFLAWANKNPESLTCEDARDFLIYLQSQGRTPATLNNKNAAMVFFYKRVLHKPWDDELVPRAINDHPIPRILSRKEVELLLAATGDLKYKAMFAIMYSAGLRVSEVIHLHYEDISRSNMQIYVRETKTRMDRYAILSKRTLDLLTEYWFACGRPKSVLFPNKFTGEYLTISTVEQAMRRSASSAGLSGKVTPHCLRHSFATHLLENGVDIRYIQALLGHLRPRSTEIYLHVSNKTIMGIRSPFDCCMKEEGEPHE